MTVHKGLSYNFQDIDAIADDLLENIAGDTRRHALGFLTLDSQIDGAALLAKLKAKAAFPIVGGTTFEYPLNAPGREISASLTVLDDERLQYALSVTEPLDDRQAAEQIKAAYDECLAKLGHKPKLWMLYAPMKAGVAMDPFISHLFALAGDVPVFGGVTTNDLDSTRALVFADDTTYDNRMLLLGLGGDIKPVFAVGSQLTVMTEYGPTVTESDGNLVHRVDDMTFCEYMRGLGIAPEDRENGVDALVQYGPLPVQLRHKLRDDDGVPELRCISFTDPEKGCAAFSSSLPVGTKVNVGMIQKNDVTESSRRCLQELTQNMQAEEAGGYKYSLVFSVTCVARYFAMLGGENLESSLLLNEAPAHLPVSTYYGFCEVGPTLGRDAEVHNRSHNASIVMCAI